MELIDLRSPNEINAFLERQLHAQFCQSWQWGELEKEEGAKVWRLGVRDGGHLVAAAQLVNRNLPLGFSYLYAPRGPVFSTQLPVEGIKSALATILGGARLIATKTSCLELAVRLEPFLALSFTGQLHSLGLIPTHAIQPPRTQIIDLSLDDSQLLAGMHPKTRYNIGLAQRHGIKVWREGNLVDKWELFARLLNLTAERHQFKIHALKHYQRIIRYLDGENGAPAAELWLAGQEGELPLAAAITISWGDTVTYLHGASDPAFKHLMAPHVMQWQIMQSAKALGYKYYDLWGIAPTDQPNHPWAGFTRFKQGFGGAVMDLVGTWDYVHHPGWYQLYRLYRQIRGR